MWELNGNEDHPDKQGNARVVMDDGGSSWFKAGRSCQGRRVNPGQTIKLPGGSQRRSGSKEVVSFVEAWRVVDVVREGNGRIGTLLLAEQDVVGDAGFGNNLRSFRVTSP